MMKIINLFGGPGVGKSTLASELFTYMKKNNYIVEITQEFAKDLTYSNDDTRLSDQILVFAEQHHKLFRLKNHVDFSITDSPILLSIAYNKSVDYKIFENFVLNVFNSYNNINFFIERDEKKFQKYGRKQGLSESLELDNIILEILERNNIEFHKIKDIEDIKKILGI